MSTKAVLVAPKASVSRTDLCDACNTRGVPVVTVAQFGAGPLMFCKHCTALHLDALEEQSHLIHSQ